jgi:hypothetical protein
MTTREQLLEEINSTPDFLLEEVLDFLLFAKQRRQQPVTPAVDALPTPPIWQAFETFADQLPEAIAATLPTDGAAQIDHYLYGNPKRDE